MLDKVSKIALNIVLRFPNSACPEKYLLNGGLISSAPNSLIRGALDGFILGSQVEAWAGRGVRLGQLLKMYYGSGVVYDKKFKWVPVVVAFIPMY